LFPVFGILSGAAAIPAGLVQADCRLVLLMRHPFAIGLRFLLIGVRLSWGGIAFAYGDVDSMYADVARECLPDGLAPRTICNGWILTSQDDECAKANQASRSNCRCMDIGRMYKTCRRIPFTEIDPCEWPSYRYACQSADCGELRNCYHSIRRLTITLTVLMLIMIVNLCLVLSEKASRAIWHTAIYRH
jgi:hypothetical protein